jgi:SAM-dependent methyltransferase
MAETNSYSGQWFELFHIPIAEDRTAREVDFVCALAPVPEFRRVLDVCCGMGRHDRALATLGYLVTGVERDARAIATGRELGGGPDYIQSDVRDFQPGAAAYDLIIVMGQSFGCFDAETNREWFARLARGTRSGGRIILDLWNPEFFAAHQGERDLETAAGIVRENKSVRDGRLLVRLAYPDGVMENFEWELFTPAQMRSLADGARLVLVNACTNFDADTKPNAANPRIQFVLQKL